MKEFNSTDDIEKHAPPPEMEHEWQYEKGCWTLFLARVRYNKDRVVEPLTPLAVVECDIEGGFGASVLHPVNREYGNDHDLHFGALREALDWCEGFFGLSDLVLIIQRSQVCGEEKATP